MALADLSHEATLALLGDVLDLAHRLPRLWALVRSLRVPVRLAREAALVSHDHDDGRHHARPRPPSALGVRRAHAVGLLAGGGLGAQPTISSARSATATSRRRWGSVATGPRIRWSLPTR